LLFGYKVSASVIVMEIEGDRLVLLHRAWNLWRSYQQKRHTISVGNQSARKFVFRHMLQRTMRAWMRVFRFRVWVRKAKDRADELCGALVLRRGLRTWSNAFAERVTQYDMAERVWRRRELQRSWSRWTASLMLRRIEQRRTVLARELARRQLLFHVSFVCVLRQSCTDGVTPVGRGCVAILGDATQAAP
jgi:hypothetical protein